MGADQPVFAFQIAGLDTSRAPRNTIEEIAREYVRAMRNVQPAGPYFLGAACAGALVAVEMANQLRGAAEPVGPLLLIDPPVVPGGDRPWWRRGWRLGRAHLGRLAPRAAVARRLARTLRRRAEDGRLTLRFSDRASLARAADALLRFEIACVKHRGWRYDGPVLILRSSTRLCRDGPERRGPFSRHFTGHVQWFDVGGHHGDVRRAGNEAMTRHLRDAVEIAQRELAALCS
jgi:thioesterase domain-containing protein